MKPENVLPPFEELYKLLWGRVFELAADHGVLEADREDLVQHVWITVLVRQGSYEPETHKTPRAWVTGIARKCCANFRRLRRNQHEVLEGEVGAMVASSEPDLERRALWRLVLEKVIPDALRREAFVYQQRYGYSVAEIAAIQGVSENVVEWRLRMAKEDLNADEDGTKKSHVLLAFGSVEALKEAMRPEPIPEEQGAELWRRMMERLGQGENGGFPSASLPLAVAATVPAAVPLSVLMFTRAKFTAILAAVFLGGMGAGGAGVLALQSRAASRPQSELAATSGPFAARQAATGPSASSVESQTLPADPRSVRVDAIPMMEPSIANAHSKVATPPKSGVGTKSAAASSLSARWLVGQMRRAAGASNFPLVLSLAQQHKTQFPADLEEAGEMERLRSEALAHVQGNERQAKAEADAERQPETAGTTKLAPP